MAAARAIRETDRFGADLERRFDDFAAVPEAVFVFAFAFLPVFTFDLSVFFFAVIFQSHRLRHAFARVI